MNRVKRLLPLLALSCFLKERIKLADFDNNFERAVDRAFEVDSGEVLNNSSPRHASYLMHKLLQKAIQQKEPVSIVSGALHAEVFEDQSLLTSLQAALKEGIPVRVVSENEVDGGVGNKFASALLDSEVGELLVSKPGQMIYDGDKHLPHFMLVGRKAFRLEIDHDSVTAYGCFNEPKLGERLSKIFDIFFDGLRTQHA